MYFTPVIGDKNVQWFILLVAYSKFSSRGGREKKKESPGLVVVILSY